MKPKAEGPVKVVSQALPKPKNGPTPMVIPSTSGSSKRESRMVTLKRQEVSADSGIGELEELGDSPLRKPEEWAKAAEFVPGQPWKGNGEILHSFVHSSLFKIYCCHLCSRS